MDRVWLVLRDQNKSTSEFVDGVVNQIRTTEHVVAADGSNSPVWPELFVQLSRCE